MNSSITVVKSRGVCTAQTCYQTAARGHGAHRNAQRCNVSGMALVNVFAAEDDVVRLSHGLFNSVEKKLLFAFARGRESSSLSAQRETLRSTVSQAEERLCKAAASISSTAYHLPLLFCQPGAFYRRRSGVIAHARYLGERKKEPQAAAWAKLAWQLLLFAALARVALKKRRRAVTG